MIHVIMPMAGEGIRFKKGGYSVLKPLIEVDGQPMFMHAYNSIVTMPHVLHCVIKRQDNIDGSFTRQIKDLIPSACVHEIPSATQGAAETVFEVLNDIPERSTLMILDCDLSFTSKEYFHHLLSENASLEGALVTFKSSKAKYSYVEVEKGIATSIVEKKVISSNAVCGAYFFSSVEIFKKSFEKIRNSSQELYLSCVVSEAIDNGRMFRVFSVDDYRSYGTPQELSSF